METLFLIIVVGLAMLLLSSDAPAEPPTFRIALEPTPEARGGGAILIVLAAIVVLALLAT